jgi:hypothetical protein
MPDHVADYAWARPDPAGLIAHGFVGVVRYLSGESSKDLSAGERDALHTAGLTIALVWETSAHRMDSGASAGHSDAANANAQADGLGFPDDRPIYYANDQNACTDAHMEYMRGARDISRRPVGSYGNTTLIDRCHDELGCAYGWKVSTWGPPTANACLSQEANVTSPIADTDMNYALKPDWGQWPYAGAPTITPAGDDMWVFVETDAPNRNFVITGATLAFYLGDGAAADALVFGFAKRAKSFLDAKTPFVYGPKTEADVLAKHHP